jgi:hypothetical protein
MRRLLPLAALLVLLTTACRIETNVGAQINADGSGVISAEIGLDDEAAEMIEQFGGGEDPFAENPLADYPEAELREEKRGGMSFRIWSAQVEDIDSVIQEQIVSGPDSFIEEFDLSIAPDRVEVVGRTSAGASMGDLEGMGDFMSAEELAESFAINLRLTLPGKILDHNADAKDGNTLTWSIPITGEALDVRAVSDPTQSEGGGFPLWAIIVIAAVVLVGIGAVALLGRKKGRAAVPPPPPPPPGPELPPA